MAVPRPQGAVLNAPRLVGDHPRGIHHPSPAQAVAGGTGPLGAVEGERARGELRHRDVAAGAGEVLAQEPLAAALDGDQDDAAGESQGLLQARAQAIAGVGAQREPVHQHVDPVDPAGVERDAVRQADGRAVDPRALEPGGARGGELLAEATLPPARDRGRDDRHRARRLLEQARGHLVRALRGDRLAAPGAVGPAERREEDPQVIVDLADRPHRGAGVGHGRALLDRDRRERARSRTRPRDAPSARGTDGPTARGSRRSAAGPPHRGCRRPGCSCPSPRGRSPPPGGCAGCRSPAPSGCGPWPRGWRSARLWRLSRSGQNPILPKIGRVAAPAAPC